MERPILHATLADRASLARVVRAALDRAVVHVALAEPPRDDRPHTLRLRVRGGPELAVLAMPVGRAVGAAFPLRLAPLDPARGEELSALLKDSAPSLTPVSLSASAIFADAPPLPPPVELPVSTEREGSAHADALEDVDVVFDPDEHSPAAAPSPNGRFDETLSSAGSPEPPTRPDQKTEPHVRFDEEVFDARPDQKTEPRVRFDADMPVTEDSGTLPLGGSDAARSSRPSSRRRTPSRAEVDRVSGRTIAGKYVIEGLVGSGAVGAVYKASHVDLGRTVAVKVLHSHCRHDPHVLASFRAEARAASLLDHPSITVVHDFGEEVDGLVYIVMEFLHGRTLQTVLDETRRFPPPRALGVMLQVCGALAAAHERGIIHRDVKPDNVMLIPTRDDEGEPRELVKVCDFGIAALEVPAGTTADWTAGTPEYMAPEQAAGRYDARTDVYACGVVLYEMLTGRPPFFGDDPTEILHKHAREAPTPPARLAPGLAPSLEAVVVRALEKAPERRFQSIRDLRAALKREA